MYTIIPIYDSRYGGPNGLIVPAIMSQYGHTTYIGKYIKWSCTVGVHVLWYMHTVVHIFKIYAGKK